MADEEILRRLDRIQATLQLAFAPQLDAVRDVILEDEVNRVLLAATTDWIASKALQDRVAAETGRSTRTVRDRLAELCDKHILETRGTERRAEYRRTGLV